MSRNRNQNRAIVINEHEDSRPRGITFNYSENFNRIIELSSENYQSWRTNILYLLMINNLEEYVTNEKIKKIRKRNIRDNLDDYLEDRFDPNLVYDQETSLMDIKNDVMVKWIIINSLGENTRKIIEGNGKTAHQIWKVLEKSFTASPEKRKLEIKNKINSLKYNEEEDINIFIAKLQNALDELENIDYELTDTVKAGILNRSLPENLRFINVFQYKNNWKRLCDYVKDVIPDIIFSNTKETTNLDDNKLFTVESKEVKWNTNQKTNAVKRRKNGKCFKCGSFGHFFHECRRKNFHIKGKGNKNKYRYKSKINRSKHSHHKLFRKRNNQLNSVQNPASNNIYSKSTFNKDYNSEDSIVLNCILTKSTKNNYIPQNNISQWIIDSGASLHITKSIGLLTNIKKCNEEITLPNGKIVTSSSFGDFIGYLNNTKFILKNVFYVRDINKNIISVTKLTQQFYKIVFFNYNNKPYSTIYDESGKRITNIFANKQNIFTVWLSNYKINFEKPETGRTYLMNLSTLNKMDKINLWHRRLGHYNINAIKNKLLKINIKTKCPICSNSKLRNFPHRISHSLARSPLELVHMDLVGPVDESIHSNRYFLTILDDHSRFGWVIFLQNKSDVFDKFLLWTKSVENIFNKSITYIRTDNGTEFNNSKFKHYCAQKGITQQFTTPYNPQQNGRAERLNGILISAAKSLLNESKLSREFWEYAVDTANYIHNRIPHSGINNKIPFEVLFKTKTDYSHFKVFGCRVFFFVPKSLRNKFDNNALPGIFLGYHPFSNSYKILNISNNKIIYSNSVEFFEDTPGNSKLSHSIPPEFSNFIPNSEIRGSDTHIFNKSTIPNTIPFNQQSRYPLFNNKFPINNNYRNTNNNLSSDNNKNPITENDDANNDKNINTDTHSKDNKLNQISNIEIKHNNNYRKSNYNKINDKLNKYDTFEKKSTIQ